MTSPGPAAPPNGAILRLQLDGHLTVAALTSATAALDAPLCSGASPRLLIVDARYMTDYDTEARAAFVSWVRGRRAAVLAIGILTTNPVWRMVIGAMALASDMRMKPFSRPADAEVWLLEQARARGGPGT